MKESMEELKCLLKSYDKKNTLKIVVISIVIVLAVIGVAASVIFFIRGCGCDRFDDDLFECDDDFDDEDEDEFEE